MDVRIVFELNRFHRFDSFFRDLVRDSEKSRGKSDTSTLYLHGVFFDNLQIKEMFCFRNKVIERSSSSWLEEDRMTIIRQSLLKKIDQTVMKLFKEQTI